MITQNIAEKVERSLLKRLATFSIRYSGNERDREEPVIHLSFK